MRRLNAWICFLSVLLIGGCAEPDNEMWQSSGPIKVRVTREYREGNDYYLFDSLDSRSGQWRRVFQVWRDATGKMPDEKNVHSVTSQLGYVYLVDHVAITHDAGARWSVFDVSKHFNCGWEGCAAIYDVDLSPNGEGFMVGKQRSGKELIDFKLITSDFGSTWWAP
jgi:hypothetical protein